MRMTNATSQNQWNIIESGGRNNATPIISVDRQVKRKRGRPLKYPELNTNHEANNVYVPNRPNHNMMMTRDPKHGTNYSGPTEQRPQQTWPVGNASSGAVVLGQEVRGVVDGTFDAGYLLSVTVGNSNVPLRGVVFKPGHIVPVSTDNDVAPNVPLIKRHNVVCPSAAVTPAADDVCALSLGRNMNHVGPPNIARRHETRHETKQVAQPTAPRGRLIVSFKDPNGTFPMREPPLESYTTGKMTELLEAVEEEMRHNKALRTNEPAP